MTAIQIDIRIAKLKESIRAMKPLANTSLGHTSASCIIDMQNQIKALITQKEEIQYRR